MARAAGLAIAGMDAEIVLPERGEDSVAPVEGLVVVRLLDVEGTFGQHGDVHPLRP